MRPTTILYAVLILAAPAFTLPLHLGINDLFNLTHNHELTE